MHKNSSIDLRFSGAVIKSPFKQSLHHGRQEVVVYNIQTTDVARLAGSYALQSVGMIGLNNKAESLLRSCGGVAVRTRRSRSAVEAQDYGVGSSPGS